MLICLRVKTLDSQDHEFSVENDITVREFKERIKEKTDIDADLQRLIYCGRVMNDDHPLSDYDVNGKVVHLVQRPPPGSIPRSVSASNASNNGETRNRRNNDNRNSPFLRAIDGMVVGAMAIPMNTNSGTTQSITHSMSPSSTLCMNRITVARHMLNCADNIASYLENPDRGLNNSEMDTLSQQTMESTVFEVGISAVSDADVPQQEMQSLVQAFQGAVSAAFRQNGLSNITVDPETGTAQATLPHILDPNGTQPSIHINLDTGSVAASSASTDEITGASSVGSFDFSPILSNAQATSSSTTVQSPIATTSIPNTTQTAPAGENAAPNATTGQNNAQQTTSPLILAEVMQQMRNVYVRLDPFMQQYQGLLQDDPAFDADDTTGRENAQRVFDRVSEALHYLSHAQHAISDLMFDLSLDTPRHLRCRPILVEQSAFVSSGFAVPNISPLGRRTGAPMNNNEASATNNNFAATNAAPVVAETSPTTTGPTSNTSPPQAMFIGGGNPNMHVARLIQAVVNSVPANANVHVDINPSGQGEFQHVASGQHLHQSQSQQQQSQSAQPQAHLQQVSSGMDNADRLTGEPDVVFRIDLDGNAPRVTTATHPTTSTQTRSTARPQGHTHDIPTAHIRNLRPVPIPTMQLSSFDRYLACNSHHIRAMENHQQAQPVHIQRTPQFQIPQPAHSAQTQSPATASARRPNLFTVTPPQPASARPPPMPLAGPPSMSEIELDTPAPFFASDFLRLQVGDFVNVLPPSDTLNRIRSVLREYAQTALCLDSPISEKTISDAIERIMGTLNELLDLLPSLNIADYDARASVEKLLLSGFPVILRIILNDDGDSNEFGGQLIEELDTFWKRLIVILLHSIGRWKTQEILGKIIETFFISLPMYSTGAGPASDALQWLRRHIHTEMCKRLQTTGLDTIDVSRFLVIRQTRQSSGALASSDLSAMETDGEDSSDNAISLATDSDTTIENDEPLPTITIGSENWHSHFDESWLPVITRDIARQRKELQSTQRAFSDAYLSGMSTKRRKLLTATKPPAAEPNAMLGQGIRRILQSRMLSVGSSSTSATSSPAVATASTLAALNEAIATNPHIQDPHGGYEQALLNHVENRLRSDADFNAERFPNASNWIFKNK